MYTRFTYGQRLTNKASIVTAEIKAIFKRIELLLYVPSISAILSSVRTRYLYVLQFLHNGFLHNSILVQVLLLDCRLHQGARARHFNVGTVRELFTKIPTANVNAFLKEIHLFHRI